MGKEPAGPRRLWTEAEIEKEAMEWKEVNDFNISYGQNKKRHNRKGYRGRMERKQRRYWTQVTNKDLREHVEELTGGRRQASASVDRARHTEISVRQEDRDSVGRRDARKEESPRHQDRVRRERGSVSERHDRLDRDRSPRRSASPSIRRGFWCEHKRSPSGYEESNSTFRNMEERILRLNAEEYRSHQEALRREREADEKRRKEFRDDMDRWTARYEREKNEMEQWRAERREKEQAELRVEKESRKDDDDLQRFKDVLADVIKPLLKKKKRKSVK